MVSFVLGTLVILVLLAWGTYRSAQVINLVPLTVNLLLLPAENVMRVGLFLICLELGQVSGLSHAALGWQSSDLARDLAFGIACGIVVALLVPPLTQVAVHRFGKQVYSPEIVRRVLPRTRREWVLVPLALVLTVFLEEVLFRSLLLGGFGVFAPPVLLAVVWSCIFGAMHLPQGPLGVLVAAGLGLLLSALFVLTGSLLAPLVAHYLINLLQLIWASLDRSWLEGYQNAV